MRRPRFFAFASRPGLAALAAVAAAGAHGHGHAEPCHPATTQQVAALFDRWNTALQSGRPERVAALYADRSVLLPTLSSKPRITAEDKLDYFAHFLGQKPVGRVETTWIDIGCNTAIDTGLYTFALANGRSVKARYTFTYRYDAEGWRITSHHSSVLPEP